MRTLPLNEARAQFSKVVDAALAGEPQRITRYGKDSVIIVSEAEWNRRGRPHPTLGHLLADFATQEGFGEDMFTRESFTQNRPLGMDFFETD